MNWVDRLLHYLWMLRWKVARSEKRSEIFSQYMAWCDRRRPIKLYGWVRYFKKPY